MEHTSSSRKQFQKLRWKLHGVLITDWSDTTAAFVVQNYGAVSQQYVIPILEDPMCKQKKLAFYALKRKWRKTQTSMQTLQL